MEMFDFGFDPLIPGDTSTLGFMEELLESQVDDMIDYLVDSCGYSVDSNTFLSTLNAFDVDYDNLPTWMKEKFDMFDIH